MATEFKIELEQMHPGVVDMDAVYHFNCRWNDLYFTDTRGAEYYLETDNEEVLINGADIIVPYSVRKSGCKVTVKGILNDYYKREETAEDTVVIDFKNTFSEEPTFFDDFETYDLSVWNEGWEYNCPGAWVEDSNLVLEVDNEVRGRIICTTGTFKQAFGCFSAKMKFPEYTNKNMASNTAFWLCSDVFDPDSIMFKKNPHPDVDPKNSRLHAGEIDIIEYSPAFGNTYPGSVHCYGWSPKYIKSSGLGVPAHTNIREGYHIISLVWLPDVLYWYCDGILTRVYDGECIKDAGKIPGAEMVVLLQAGNKGSERTWVGLNPTEPIPTQRSLVDWVKVHSLKK